MAVRPRATAPLHVSLSFPALPRACSQVEAGGTRLELYGTEITQCGNGDDVVPKDLGAVDIQVSPSRLRRVAWGKGSEVFQRAWGYGKLKNSEASQP